MAPMISMTHEGATLFAHDSPNATKKAVLAIHGGLADHASGLRLAESIAASHRVVAPDLRASGKSIFAGPLDWKMLARDLRAWLDHLGIERAAVLGTSMGSGVALRFALDFPERCAGLVLVSPVYLGGDHPLVDAQRDAFAAMNAFAERSLRDGIGALLPIYDALPPPLRDRARAMASRFDPTSLMATVRLLNADEQPFEALDDLRAIASPTMSVPGADPQHPAIVAETYARVLPNAHVAAAANFANALPTFLESLAW